MELYNAKKLAEIIIKVRLDRASEAEREYLLEWLDRSESNRQTYKNIISGVSLVKRIGIEQRINDNVNLDEITSVIARRIIQTEYAKKVTFAAGLVAGCILLFLVLTPYVFTNRREVGFTSNDISSQENSKVRLVTASGKVVDLVEYASSDSSESQKKLLLEGKKGLELLANGFDEIELTTNNKIITEIGGEISFTLGDGTKVWLNSMSEFEFPITFGSESREVFLSGEAYFEVKPDSKRPFVVHSGKHSVKVLGTSFNIKAYKDESNVYTTLVEGSVKIETADGEVNLTPGKESVYNMDESDLIVRPANLDYITAWKTGYFLFNEEELEDILRVLNRWYGIEFIYNTSQKHTFSGRFGRHNSLENILKAITMAGGPTFDVNKEDPSVTIVSIK